MKIVLPAKVGLDQNRLGRVSNWLEQQVIKKRIAGASLLLCRRGQPAFFEAVGASEIETGRVFSEDTIVRVFSMTKPITTVAAMMLYEQGCFQLDHPVSRYLPAFADTPVWSGGDITATVAQQTPMTIRQLMTHTAGLTYGFMQQNVIDAEYRGRGLEQRRSVKLADWVDSLADIPLLCQPGSQWNYSVATDVLGRLVEIWSGLSLAEFFEAHICGPLGMVDTGFSVPADQTSRFAALYGPSSGQTMASVAAGGISHEDRIGGLRLIESADNNDYLKPPEFFSGGGGLVSTMSDYARFCQMLMNRGELDGSRLLSRKTVEFMRLNQLPNNGDMASMGQPVWSETSYEGIGFGIGWAVVLDPVKAHIIASVGEHHWGGAASTFFWLDPEEELFVIFLTQLIPSSTYPIRRELRSRIYQTLVN
jgi:CubicO group peptidase (beta-lactamase class C family)